MCTYILVDVEAHTCHSRGAHVACTRTYSGQCATKKIRPRMCTHGWGLECLLAHIYVRPGLVSMAGSKRRNSVVVVFMGTQPLGQNRMRRRVHREGLDRTGDGNEAWRTAERRNGLVFDRPRSKRDPIHWEGSGIPQNGGNRLVLDLLWSKRGPVDQEGCGVPQNGGNRLVLERYG